MTNYTNADKIKVVLENANKPYREIQSELRKRFKKGMNNATLRKILGDNPRKKLDELMDNVENIKISNNVDDLKNALDVYSRIYNEIYDVEQLLKYEENDREFLTTIIKNHADDLKLVDKVKGEKV